MPIYLKPDSYSPNGPDGKGWNRLRVDAIEPSPQCAMLPKTYSALRECQNTMLAKYGPYKNCVRSGDCSNCDILNTTENYLEQYEDNEIMIKDGDIAYDKLNRDTRYYPAKFVTTDFKYICMRKK